MQISQWLGTVAATLTPGIVTAHTGIALLEHPHPHLGAEHLALTGAAACAAWVLVKALRRGG